MKPFPLSTLLVAAVIAGAACDRRSETVTVTVNDEKPVAQTKTFETARLTSAIDAYAARPSAENAADVNKAFAEIDGEIGELQARVARTSGEERQEAAVKLKNLETFRAEEGFRYTQAKATSGLERIVPADGRPAGEKLEDTARDTGNALEDAAKKTGDAIKDAVR